MPDRFLSDLRGTLRNVFRITPATSSGAPSTGTYALGDLYMDSDGVLYRCTIAGSPGTWEEVGGGGSSSSTLNILEVRVFN